MKGCIAAIWLLSCLLMAQAEFDDCNRYIRSPEELAKIFPPDPLDVFYPPSCGKKADECDPDSKYRTLDGSCNNLDYPEWGLPNSTYSRLLPAAFSDGISSPRMAHDNSPLPGARRVRVQLLPKGSRLDKGRSIAAMQFGQIIAHDMSLQKDPTDDSTISVRCCTPDAKLQDDLSKFCYQIKISPHDPDLGAVMSCMNFSRSITDKDLGCAPSKKSPAQQINTVTSWLDLSLVYDISKERSDGLRTKKDGLMTVVIRGGQEFPPQDLEDKASCRCNMASESTCYKGGDSRMNQSPHLALLQILLLREHNRLARELKKINPSWDDERLFQEARRINIAQYQYITYYEWMPELLGYRNLVKHGIIFPNVKYYVDDYDSSVAPDVSNEHAHGALRHFHSQIAETLNIMDENRNTNSSINIGIFLHRPGRLDTDFGGLARGLISQATEKADRFNVPAIVNRMFVCNDEKYGTDLRSFDIQRDRDHGLRYYNDYRNYCGLRNAKSFDNFRDYISSKDINKMRKLYNSYLDVDLTIGGALEKKVSGSQLGPTFQCIVLDQFKRTRQADRFWFEHRDAGFTKAQLAQLKKSSLSRLLCDNEKSIGKIQKKSFRALKSPAELVPCSSIPVVNLQKWKE